MFCDFQSYICDLIFSEKPIMKDLKFIESDPFSEENQEALKKKNQIAESESILRESMNSESSIRKDGWRIDMEGKM